MRRTYVRSRAFVKPYFLPRSHAGINMAVMSVIAVGLSSFEGIEEPTVVYHPQTQSFTTGDPFVNIIDVERATVRFRLRYSPDWWDGDRSTANKDRQRAE